MIKKEVKCVFSDPDYSWPVRAARMSLSSIDVHTDDDTDEAIIEAFERIRTRWLRCFNKLEATGMFGERKLQKKKCRQCPPPGFQKVVPKSTGCHMAYLCPFCWIRQYAEETYNRFAEVIEIGDGYVPPPAGVRLAI